MKKKLFILSIGFYLITLSVNAQIKIHSNGGISIGSETDPLSEKTVFSDPVEVSNALITLDEVTFSNVMKIHNSGGISIGNTVDPGSGQTVFSVPVGFNSINPNSTNTYDLGSSSLKWKDLHVRNTTTDYLTIEALNPYGGQVKSDLIPYTDNMYSLGMKELSYDGPHKWKEIYTYNLNAESIDLDGVDLTSTSGSYGPDRLTIQLGTMGNLEINCGPTSYLQFYTSRSYYRFDEDIWIPSEWVTSDINLKENISKISEDGSSIEKIKKIEGIKYNLKDDKDKLKLSGFSAQELQKVLPDLVVEDEDGFLAVNYTGIIPYLLEAIKEQEARIESLEKQLGK